VHSGKVALPGGMLGVGSVMVVAVHSTCLSTVMVAASERWVYASGVVAIASKIEGAAFALAFVVGSSVEA
jgi:Na+/proline symporter